ncbi:O-antigen polymerase [Pseudotamlana haliotis]|uniref:O-antigen polymerase n=1 Tax=Pseudotamlana haliotis TaxID=2614804 RepID=UPI00177AA25B|nr:O-antigen polymerase [Tamlana haliotis]
MIYILIFLVLIQLFLLTRNLKYYFLSPVYIYVLFSGISILISVLYFYYYDDKYNMFRLDEVSNEDFINTIEWYLIALNSFIFGFLLYHNFSLRATRNLLRKPFNESLFFNLKLPENIVTIVSGLFFTIVLLYFVSYGTSLFYRDQYLPKENVKALIVLIKLLSLVQVILLGIIYDKNKLLSITYFFIMFLLSIGTGSRTVILTLLLYFILIFISKGNTLKNKITFFINIFLTFIFLGYLMNFRSQEAHGILPYIESIFTSERQRDSFFNVYYSLIFGVFVTIRTLKDALPDWHVIYVSLNPLPGSMVGWYDIASDMRINRYAPFSLHGRVFKMGFLFTFCYFIFTGLIYSFFERLMRSYLNIGNKWVPFILVILLTLHIVYGFEYNMRSSVRYLYYSFAFVVLVVVANKVYNSLIKPIEK